MERQEQIENAKAMIVRLSGLAEQMRSGEMEVRIIGNGKWITETVPVAREIEEMAINLFVALAFLACDERATGYGFDDQQRRLSK